MYEVVVEVLDAHGPLVATLLALANAKTAFSGKISAIRSAHMVQLMSTKGKTMSKKGRKELLTDMAYTVASAVQAYASVEEDDDLYELVKFGRWEILQTEDEELAQVCQLIHDTANGVVADLADYGVTPAMLTELQDGITGWASQSQLPRLALSQRKVATENMKLYFDQADDILTKQMDNLMEQFKGSQPDFYNTYHAARKIVHSPTTSMTVDLEGNVFDTVSGAVIVGATVADTEAEVSTVTDESGNFVLEGVPKGERVLTVSAEGYGVLNIEVDTSEGTDGFSFGLEPEVEE